MFIAYLLMSRTIAAIGSRARRKQTQRSAFLPISGAASPVDRLGEVI